MILKSLELQGFKSFPDKTVFEFGNGITSVVGPNGSGKSNIADAVRWVLGEQSTKSLRGSRMEDVIFSGTGVRKAQGFAEVTLRLDNKDKTLVKSDADEVSVTRRYFRSGESEYIINGEVTRLRDVHEMFMDTGLGRDGYSMVSQGRIADLISSKSAQRREMLEEAAGISQYRYRRTNANTKLEQAEENLVRLRDILSELEGRVGPLRTQSEKAQKFIVLAKEKKELEIGLWLNTIEKSKNSLREQEHKLLLTSTQYDEINAELEQLANSVDELTAKGQSITVQIENIRLDSASLEEQAVKLDGEIAVENNTIIHNKESIERLLYDVGQASDTEQHIDEQIALALEDIDTLIGMIKQKTEKLAEATAGISGAKEENSIYADKSATLSQQITELTSELSEKRILNSTSLSAIEELETRITNIDTVLSTRGSVVDDMRAQSKACADELQAAKDEAESLSNSMSGYQLKAEKRREKAEKLRKVIDDLNLDIHQRKARIKMLDDLEKNMEGYSGSVRTVMRESGRGTLRGIHGPLSQLITVKDKYAVAVETALGAAIQHIVTDTENDAKRAISYLKENRAGRATFLPITSVTAKDFTEKGLENCAGYVAMADELLEFDAKYTEIIRSQLCRTVVAEDMDSAIAMAKKYSYRIKIVTLDGQIINAGGSMTGGSRGQGSGFLSRANEIEKLTEKVTELQKDFDGKQEELKKLTEELAAAEAELGGAGAELARAQEEVIRKESELQMLEGKLETALAALDDLKSEKVKSQARIEEMKVSCEAVNAEIAELNTKIDEVNGELAELGKSRELLEAKRNELAELEASINLEILASQKDIESKEEIIASLRRRRLSHEGRVDELMEEINNIKKNNEDIEEKIKLMTERAAALREHSRLSKESVERLVAERTEVEGNTTGLRASERQKNDDKEKLGGELARLEERKATVEKALEDAQNKLYDEYQLTLREADEMNIVLDDPAQAQRVLNEIKGKIRALGSVNVGAIEEYKEVSERYEYMSCQIKDIENSRDELVKLITELTGKMSERFREQFIKINSYFSETFVELFDGGKAELVLENPLDVLESNIEIKVQPPGKNVQNIDLLSGGEKGLSAIALLFAILKVKPAPFCIFDEVEAALDDINVTRYAKYVRRMTKNTQFILITHRRGTMEEADVLYGITMQEEGVSKLLELKTAEMAKKLGID